MAFLAAVAVGALAGLVPATIAVRSKVIDAIRYRARDGVERVPGGPAGA